MTGFSEEGRLLIERWRTVEDVLASIGQLGKDLTAWLYSLEEELAEPPWWKEGWVFQRRAPVQVYISNRAWQVGDEYAVWVGIENVTPGALFGSGPPPQLYLWVSNRNSEMLSALVNRLNKGDLALPGEVDTHTASFYAARRSAMQYIGGDIDAYMADLRGQIMGFFVAYAQWLWRVDPVIRELL